jgi:hypothetical protein
MPISGGAVMSTGARRKRPHKHICGTPGEYCIGSYTGTSSGLGKNRKMHGSPQQAFTCYAHYLIENLKYTQIGPREFAAPNNGPVLVLTKKSKFGARCRGGKGERFMPEVTPGGHVVSC